MPGLQRALLYGNDRAGAYPESWYAASAHALPESAPLVGEVETDVCIIGAGYTGLSAALHLARSGLRVRVLEAHRIGFGASGRNGGQVCMGQRLDQDLLERKLGREHAHRLWDIAREAVTLVRTLVREQQIDCDLQDGIIHADHRARFLADSRAYVDKLQQDYGQAQIRFLEREELRTLLNSPLYFGGTLDLASAHLHPLNYALGLARAARAGGAVIHEHSAVLDYRNDTKGVQVRLQRGSVRAAQLILACNGYLDRLEPTVARHVMPINNYMVATEPMSESTMRALIREHHAVADSRFVVNYYRFSADRRLLFGGGENYRYRFPADIRAFVRPHLLRVFPQLADVRLDHGWGGTLAITVNRMPCFLRPQPNVWSAGGYSGHGVAMATMAGRIMAEAVQGTLTRFDAMHDVPMLPFPGGTLLRWPLLALAMFYYSLRDRL